MANWKDSLPSQWLKAADFSDGPALLTIKRFGVEEIGDGKKPCVWFEEMEKGLALNLINGNTIEDIARSGDPDDWHGVKVVLYKTQTEMKGKNVDCIRVRAPKAGSVTQPKLQPEEDNVPF
jgi:hypothetical protein